MNVLRTYLDQLWLTWRLLRDRRVAWWIKIIGVLPFVYLVSPIDLIPDFLPVLGQMDDIAILYAGMRLFESLVPEYIVREHRAAIALRHIPRGDGGVISGRARRRR
ncbi:MAG: DUF1232 domain-containing protein [Anaerolinea sp.]|nr:DUF1232 domain-containing protein [Anaerolinea sp.]